MKSIHTLIFLIASLGLFAQNTKDEIIGLWYNEDKTEMIEIYIKDHYYYGKIHWLKNSTTNEEATRDVYNENPQYRSRVLTGIDVLLKFEYKVGRDKWKSGEIYNYKNGNTYNGKMRINSQGNLEVHGYWWFLSFLGSTKTYTKVK
jgi:uncharacterized protein (DUF2147 family)